MALSYAAHEAGRFDPAAAGWLGWFTAVATPGSDFLPQPAQPSVSPRPRTGTTAAPRSLFRVGLMASPFTSGRHAAGLTSRGAYCCGLGRGFRVRRCVTHATPPLDVSLAFN